MSLNLHAICRGAIEVVNTDVDGTVYVSTGKTNVRGILTPTYAPVTARLQVQAQKHTPITHERDLQTSNAFLTIYAYGNFSDIERRTQQGGDLVHVPSGPRAGWYLSTQTLEWWDDFCAFEVTVQLNAATIQAYIDQTRNGSNP
jgi:hypothetical protein